MKILQFICVASIFILDCQAKGQTQNESSIITQNIDTSSVYLSNKDLRFKGWLKDTLVSIKRYGLTKRINKIGVLNRKYKVYSDSLTLEIRTNISAIIKHSRLYQKNTIIGLAIYGLKLNHVKLPDIDYEIRISYLESYDVSYHNDWIYEKTYTYDYLSIRPINSQIETSYYVSKGNVISTENKRKIIHWIPED
jgi:hypothetical protein